MKKTTIKVPKGSTNVDVEINGEHYPLILKFNDPGECNYYWLEDGVYDGHCAKCKDAETVRNMTYSDYAVASIAKVCHEANRAYCETHDDKTQPSWEDAPQWQKDSAIAGVRFRLDNPDAGNDAMHKSWLEEKLADGWKHGEEKDAVLKTHPCIVPYDQLPEYQKKKDVLFSSIVDALK